MAHASSRSGPDDVRNDIGTGPDLTEKYLTFRLGAEEYGLEILKVREIIGLMTITPVPRAPNDVRGVINLRGKIIPVVDLRRRFLMQELVSNDRNCIIVVDVKTKDGSVEVGVLVDEVSEVLDIPLDQIGPPPSFSQEDGNDFILGMAKVGERVILLLQLENVLSGIAIHMSAAKNELEAVA